VKALEETMCEKELLVSYLYDDLGDADRAKFDTHLRGCVECRAELNALRGVRADLISWSPPQPDFGFRMVREPRVSNDAREPKIPAVVAMTPRSLQPARPVTWRAWWTPAAGLAAAAVLVLAAAAGLARIEVHSGPEGFTVRTGWSAFAPQSGRSFGETGSSAAAAGQGGGDAAAAPLTAAARVPGGAAAVRSTLDVDPAFIAALDRRLRALEAATRNAAPVRNASTMSARASDAEILRRVREMLAQSETKQLGELALRIAHVIRDVDAQHVADLTRIQQGLRGIEASVATVDAGQRELATYMLTTGRQK
jgi:hypothetical protein